MFSLLHYIDKVVMIVCIDLSKSLKAVWCLSHVFTLGKVCRFNKVSLLSLVDNIMLVI